MRPGHTCGPSVVTAARSPPAVSPAASASSPWTRRIIRRHQQRERRGGQRHAPCQPRSSPQPSVRPAGYCSHRVAPFVLSPRTGFRIGLLLSSVIRESGGVQATATVVPRPALWAVELASRSGPAAIAVANTTRDVHRLGRHPVSGWTTESGAPRTKGAAMAAPTSDCTAPCRCSVQCRSPARDEQRRAGCTRKCRAITPPDARRHNPRFP